MHPDSIHGGLVVAGAVCWLLALLAYFLGYRRSSRRYDAIVEVPTIAARDIPGLGASMVEVKGIVRVDTPLISDLARVPCVAFTCSVTEHWTTTRTERDAKGHTRTVTEHHSETRYANDGRIAFQVRDSSGDAAVEPDGAEMELLDSMTSLDGPLPDSPAYELTTRHFGGRLRYSESVLPIGQTVYVLGEVGEDHAIRSPLVQDRPFLITHRTEESLRRAAVWGMRIGGVLAAALFVAGFALLGSGLRWIDAGR